MYSGKIAVPPGGGGIRIIIITPVIMLISTALLLDSNIRNSVCTIPDTESWPQLTFN
jgi:hypothetical protein